MRKKSLILIVILGIGLFLKILPSLQVHPTSTTAPDSSFYSVTYVVDGDTVKIMKGDHEETLRFLGINTPEVDGGYRRGECFGPEASAETKKLLTGKNVRIQTDSTQSERDKYNRLLVYVFLEDGTNINEQLIKTGFAREYTYAGSYQYQKEFRLAQDEARANGRGLWNKRNCPN